MRRLWLALLLVAACAEPQSVSHRYDEQPRVGTDQTAKRSGDARSDESGDVQRDKTGVAPSTTTPQEQNKGDGVDTDWWDIETTPAADTPAVPIKPPLAPSPVTTPGPAPVPTTPKPELSDVERTTWRGIGIIYRNLDVNFSVDGVAKTAKDQMTAAEVTQAKAELSALPAKLALHSKGMAKLTMTTVEVIERPISAVSSSSASSHWVSPESAKPEIDRLVTKGKFDSVIVLWPNGHERLNHLVNMGSTSGTGRVVGLTSGGPGVANGAGFSSVMLSIRNDGTRLATNEVIGHEWLHQVEAFYGIPAREVITATEKRNIRLIHDFPHYGYRAENGTLYHFYGDFMMGAIVDVDDAGKKLGVSKALWDSGTPKLKAIP